MAIARDGADVFYLAKNMKANDGLLGRVDLETYELVINEPL